jgi:dipeptidyl aminopeptidase/acylaminoacyl peptidase
MKRLPLLLLSALSLTTIAWADPVTPESLYAGERPSAVALSPDGKFLCVQIATADVSKNKNYSQIRVYSMPIGRDSEPLTTIKDASGATWSPDSKNFLYLATADEKTQAFLCRADDWDTNQLTHHKTSIEQPIWSSKGDKIAFVSGVDRQKPISGVTSSGNSGRIYDDLFARRWNHYYDGKFLHWFVQDLDSGEAQDVTPGDRDSAPTCGSYSSHPNACFSGDGSKLYFAAPPVRGHAYDTNYDVYELDLRSKRRSNLTVDNPAGDFGPRLSPDGQRVYYLRHNRKGYESDRAQIVSFPTIDPKQLRIEDSLNRPLGVAEWYPTDQGAIYTFLEEERSKMAVVRNGQARTVEHSGSSRSISFDQSLKQIAFINTSLKHPPRVVLQDLASGQTQLLPAPASKVFPSILVENVMVAVEDAQMPMWIIKPPNFDPNKRWPVAYIIHGGPQGGWSDDWSLRWNAQTWAARGYVVAMPNPRGSSGRSQSFQDQVSRDWGGKAYRDLMKGVDYLEALPYIDKDRMLASGASYGGYMVNWISVNTGRFKALVTHCGLWNLESMYGTTDELFFTDWEFGGPPWGPNMPSDYQKFSPHKFAEKIGQFKTPHMIIHNDLDYRCPINQGLEHFTALQRQNVPSRLLNFPDEGHWVSKPANSVRWYREVFNFVEQYCPPGPSK